MSEEEYLTTLMDTLEDLDFADDMLLTHRHQDIQRKLTTWPQ